MLRDSKITIHNADLDIEGTYPSVQQATNACKQTTVKEIIRIEGLSELEQRQLGINLSGGIVNDFWTSFPAAMVAILCGY